MPVFALPQLLDPREHFQCLKDLQASSFGQQITDTTWPSKEPWVSSASLPAPKPSAQEIEAKESLELKEQEDPLLILPEVRTFPSLKANTLKRLGLTFSNSVRHQAVDLDMSLLLILVSPCLVQ
jgi:hypothetical protein